MPSFLQLKSVLQVTGTYKFIAGIETGGVSQFNVQFKSGLIDRVYRLEQVQQGYVRFTTGKYR